MTIVRDEDVRSGEPRISGSRITVLDCKRRILDHGEDPHVVAGEYDVALADLFTALAYYYDNREEFRDREREASDARSAGERRTRDLLEEVENGSREAGERAD